MVRPLTGVRGSRPGSPAEGRSLALIGEGAILHKDDFHSATALGLALGALLLFLALAGVAVFWLLLGGLLSAGLVLYLRRRLDRG